MKRGTTAQEAAFARIEFIRTNPAFRKPDLQSNKKT